MASERDSMRSNANGYISKISSAKDLCADASRNMNNPMADLSDAWKGDSGSAMYNALDSIKYDLNKVYVQLANLESKMNAHVNSIYNNWPEPKPVSSSTSKKNSTSSAKAVKTTQNSTNTSQSKTTTSKTATKTETKKTESLGDRIVNGITNAWNKVFRSGGK